MLGLALRTLSISSLQYCKLVLRIKNLKVWYNKTNESLILYCNIIADIHLMWISGQVEYLKDRYLAVWLVQHLLVLLPPSLVIQEEVTDFGMN